MKTVALLVVATMLTLTGCSFDASSRPLPPAQAAVIPDSSQAYCCAGCDVGDEQAVCTSCRRTSAASCADNSERLLCVTNRVEVPESQSTLRVTCY